MLDFFSNSVTYRWLRMFQRILINDNKKITFTCIDGDPKYMGTTPAINGRHNFSVM